MQKTDLGTTRRDFLKIGVASTGLFLGGFGISNLYAADDQGNPDPLQGVAGATMIRTACMMCNAGCGLQVKVKGGVALKIEGNPFCVHTNDYSTAGAESVAGDITNNTVNSGRICVRGNSGLMTLYDPYRLKTPLKRVGPRGSGQFEAISWSTAMTEIAAALAACRDNVLDIDATDTDYGTEGPGGVPAGYGKKSNRYVWSRGRDQISQITKRFNDAYGTKNHIEHSSICNTAWAIGAKANFPAPAQGNSYKYHRVDLDNCTYLIILGSNPLEANVGTPFWQRKITDRLASGSFTLTVVDPFFTHTAAKANRWVPIKPGGDFAFVMAMLRRMIDTGTGLDTTFLRIPNITAANAAGYRNYVGAAFLVNTATHKFMSGAEAGITPTTTLTIAATSTDTTLTVGDTTGFSAPGSVRIDSEIIHYTGLTPTTFTGCTRGSLNLSAASHLLGATVSPAFVVVDTGGTAQPYTNVATTDNYNYSGTVNGVAVKSAFRHLYDEGMTRTVDEWAALCEIDVPTIQALVTEWTAAARPCLEAYRGAFAHSNGAYTQMAVNIFNAVTGRVDRLGGYATGPRFGASEPTRNPAFPTTGGVRIDRAGSKYTGTPPTPTRQWYYTASQISQEMLPSAGMGYPYKVKVMTFYCYNPVYTFPVASGQKNALLATDGSGNYKIEKTVSHTIFMDETAVLCDYILPDSTYLERFSAPFTGYPTVHTKSGTIRRPVVGTYRAITAQNGATRIYIPPDASLNGNTFADASAVLANWSGPMPYDEQLIQLGKLLGLPGFGTDGMGVGVHLDTAYQFWDRALASASGLTAGAGLGGEGATGVPGDSANANMTIGGRWENPAQIEHGTYAGWVRNLYGDYIALYDEKIGTSKNYMISPNPYLYGYPKWMDPRTGQTGIVHTDAAYPFRLLTYKRVFHTQSRSASNQWLRELQTQGFVYLNSGDAAGLSVVTGDYVKITSPNGRTTTARARVIEGLKPGCVMVDHHFGRDWFGSKPYTVDGVLSAFDASIGGAGAFTNDVYRPDSAFGDVPLTDTVSGQVSFFDTQVSVSKV